MSDVQPEIGLAPAGDDAVVPFQVAALDTRGRAVQLGAMLDGILGRHAYPPEVARLLAEAVALTVILGTSLKFSGKFILQTQSNGPVSMLVADFRAPQSVRAYANFDAELLAEAIAEDRTSPAELLGSGTLALTIDQGEHMQRYQGIVALDGSSLEEVARVYFRQSEQIPTHVRLSTATLIERNASGEMVERIRAGGMIVQFLPESPDRMRHSDLSGGDAPEGVEIIHNEDDAWMEAKALASTIEDSELTDPQVGVEGLLYRLFNQHNVIVYPATNVLDECACSEDKIRDVLRGFSAEEIRDSIEDGVIRVTCEFCSTHYVFKPEEFGV